MALLLLPTLTATITPSSCAAPCEADLNLTVTGPFRGEVCGHAVDPQGQTADHCEPIDVAAGRDWVLLWPFGVSEPGDTVIDLWLKGTTAKERLTLTVTPKEPPA